MSLVLYCTSKCNCTDDALASKKSPCADFHEPRNDTLALWGRCSEFCAGGVRSVGNRGKICCAPELHFGCTLRVSHTELYRIYMILIYLLTAIGLTPGGSSTVHIYTQTIHRTTQLTTLVGRLSGIRTQSGRTKINDDLTA